MGSNPTPSASFCPRHLNERASDALLISITFQIQFFIVIFHAIDMASRAFHRNSLFGISCLVLASVIWGTAFVAQKTGMDDMGPMLFNASRSFLGSACLMIFLPLLDRLSGRRPGLWGECSSPSQRRILLSGGLCCGIILTIAGLLQQIGIQYTSVGKSGFLTALYIVMVPIAGLFLHRRSTWVMWVSAVMAMFGTYLLCGVSPGSFNRGDLWLIACSFAFTGHILVIDYFAPRTDCVRMSCLQFLVAGLLSLICGLCFGESASFDNLRGAWLSILYCGMGSSAIAYTLQIVGQKHVHPAIASLVMSLESVFSVLGGWLILGQRLTPLELTGCAIIFAAVLLAQVPVPTHDSSKES